MPGRSLLFVHAHPDDETLTTGGTIARYSDEGAHVTLVTCTNGEAGEIADVPGLGPADDVRDRLGEIRIAELREACRHLGRVDIRALGFHDSGMDGTPTNDDPNAFINQDMSACVDAIVDVVLDVRPQVLVTYDPSGLYGHPDHIRAHRAALRAVTAVAEAGHEVQKIYYTAVPKGLMRMGRELAERLNWSRKAYFSEEDIERMGTDDHDITTTLDVSRFVDRKVRALEAHRTQLGTTEMFLRIPEEVRPLVLGAEHFVLAQSTVGSARAMEHDVFERIV